MNKEIVSDNLYEIPSCTICLSQLCQDLSNLACGHVFHINCISQQFQYRGSCPNCQKRSNLKEIRQIHYPLIKNNQSGQQLRDLISNLNHSERNQVEGLLAEVKKVTERNQRYKAQVEQYEKETKKSKKQLSDTITQLNRKKLDSQTYRKELLQLKKVIQFLHGQIKTLNDEDLRIRTELQTYRQKQGQFKNIKTLKRIMNDNAEGLIKYKNQLQAKNTPAQQMARQFFEMILLKNMQMKRVKQKMESFPQMIADKDNQINKFRNLYLKQKKQKDSLLQKRNLQKKKYQELKGKFKKLVQKYKTAIQRQGQDNYNQNENENDIFLFSNFTEDSQGFLTNNTSVPRNNLPQKVGYSLMGNQMKTSNLNNANKQNIQNQQVMEADKVLMHDNKYNKNSSSLNLSFDQNNNYSSISQKDKSIMGFYGSNITTNNNLRTFNSSVLNGGPNHNNDIEVFIPKKRSTINFGENQNTYTEKMSIEQKQPKQWQQKTQLNSKNLNGPFVKQTQLNFKAQYSFNQVPSNQTFNNQNKQMVYQANKNGQQQTKLSYSGFSGAGGKFKKNSDGFAFGQNLPTSGLPGSSLGKRSKPSMKNLMM